MSSSSDKFRATGMSWMLEIGSFSEPELLTARTSWTLPAEVFGSSPVRCRVNEFQTRGHSLTLSDRAPLCHMLSKTAAFVVKRGCTTQTLLRTELTTAGKDCRNLSPVRSQMRQEDAVKLVRTCLSSRTPRPRREPQHTNPAALPAVSRHNGYWLQ